MFGKKVATESPDNSDLVRNVEWKSVCTWVSVAVFSGVLVVLSNISSNLFEPFFENHMTSINLPMSNGLAAFIAVATIFLLPVCLILRKLAAKLGVIRFGDYIRKHDIENISGRDLVIYSAVLCILIVAFEITLRRTTLGLNAASSLAYYVLCFALLKDIPVAFMRRRDGSPS